MLLSGLWHGATDLQAWGAFSAALLSVYRLIGNEIRSIASRLSGVQTVVLFHLVCVGWILFRATSLSESFLFLEASRICPLSLPPADQAGLDCSARVC
ncbi:MAG: hypothetical protein U0936_20235 [Planctomycetaceae bacterium]